MEAKIKKQGRTDFATRTILKAMLSALDNMLNPKVQDKAKHLGSWWDSGAWWIQWVKLSVSL